jgi:protein-S-isoprenylcysteine O-methyltransferase Ste14
MQPGKDALMNTVAAHVDGHLAVGGTELTVSSPLTPLATVKKSFAYRARLWMTGVSMGIGFMVAALNRPLAELSLPVEWSLELLGWATFLAGAAIRVWASSYICARKSRDVVCTGPYSICRNPLYWGTFLMVAAFPLLLKSPVLAAAMVPPILLYLFAVVPVEEAVMSSRHGAEYAGYCSTVSRWWPNVFGYVKGEALDSQTEGYLGECSRLGWWLAMAVGFDVLFHFANASWWLHPLHWW